MIEPGPVPVPDGTLARHLRPHRFTVVVLVPAVGVALMALGLGAGVAWAGRLATFPPLLVLANLVMALPLLAALAPVLDRRAWVGLAILAGFAYLIEGIGVATGWPYGRFAYQAGLEPLLLDTVPLALPLFWLPMLVSAYLLALRGLGPRAERGSWDLVLATALAAIGLDLIMDPGAVALGFWAWQAPGAYHGVPAVNFLGWALSGAIGALILVRALPAARVRPRLVPGSMAFDSLLAFLVFWGAVNAWQSQWLPALAALALGTLVWRWGGGLPRRAGGHAPRVEEPPGPVGPML